MTAILGTHASTARAQKLYWGQTFGDRILSAELDGANSETLLEWPELDDPVGVAVDAISGKLYWAQTFSDRILRADLDGANSETLLEWPELDDPVGIAVDPLAGKVYWAQAFGDHIRRANLDGTGAETLLEWPELDDPIGIAVDPIGGKIYWAQTFGDRILRANLDGTSVETLLEWPELDDPVGIAVDPIGGKVYWAQTFGDRILRANLDGTGAETLLEWPELDDPVGLAVDPVGGKIYWAQTFGDRILRANLDGTSAEMLLEWPELDGPVGIALDTQMFGVNAPLRALPPHHIAKNRFLSINPNNPNAAVVLRVELLDRACSATGRTCTTPADCRVCVGGDKAGFACSIGADCTGGGDCTVSGETCLDQAAPTLLGWVSVPFEPDPDATSAPVGTLAARIQKSMPAPRVWDVAVLHLGDCEIAPVRSYAISASADGVTFSPRLAIGTIAKPAGKFWGDVAGGLVDGSWTEPNGIVNVNDILAWINFATFRPAPHVTVLDLADEVPNFVINATDLALILQAFQGRSYPPPPFPNQGSPTDCP